MPPRKRAESVPKTEESSVEALAEAEGAPAVADEEQPAPPAEAKPKRNKPANLPCAECFPNGWPETSTAVGCEHGSWTRD